MSESDSIESFLKKFQRIQKKFLDFLDDEENISIEEPKTQENYSIVVTYDDNKYPDQAFSISLYPSGAQLYNEMHSN